MGAMAPETCGAKKWRGIKNTLKVHLDGHLIEHILPRCTEPLISNSFLCLWKSEDIGNTGMLAEEC
jgi:hypothetical protein